jgi:hypothetical protein
MTCRAYPDFCHESPIMFDPAIPKVRANGLVGPDVCRPGDNVARRAPFFPAEIRADVGAPEFACTDPPTGGHPTATGGRRQ